MNVHTYQYCNHNTVNLKKASFLFFFGYLKWISKYTKRELIFPSEPNLRWDRNLDSPLALSADRARIQALTRK